MPRYATDLTGRVFGALTVISRQSNDRNGPARCLCRCSCGNEKTITSSNLNSGSYTSCGCGVVRIENQKTHGMRDTRVYRIWLNMKDRCLRKENKSYADYGGRGVSVCERWKDSFENFYADMGDPPSDDHSIERRDNGGNYEPGNCFWATRIEQGANKRNNVLVTYNGQTRTLAEWARELGVSYDTLKRRKSLGWTDNDIIGRPIRA